MRQTNVPRLRGMTDAALLTHLRDAISTAQNRPALKGALRQLLASCLEEQLAEMLAPSDLSAEQIADYAAELVRPARQGLHILAAEGCA